MTCCRRVIFEGLGPRNRTVAALSYFALDRLSAHTAGAALTAIAVLAAAAWPAVAAAQEPPGQPDPAAEHAGSDVRAHTRIVHRGGTAVTDAQAAELTLTLTEAAVRPVQTWVRAAGALDKTGHLLTTFVSSPDADHIAVGQRVRTFS